MNPRLTDWSEQVAWIIGASSGIGRATAARLHAAGAKVVVSARGEPALQAFVQGHAGSMAVPLDVTDPGSMRDATAAVLSRHGRIDLVMYCAGTYRPQRATGFDLAAQQQHLAVNYVGALQLLDAVLPTLLMQGRGHLSLVGSVAGYRGLPHALAYGPTKAALINLAEVLYLDLHPKGIGVSLINPGFVETPLTAQNAFRMPALITPDAAADAILTGWRRGRFEIHFPRRFTMWLKALRLLTYGPYFAAIRRSTGL